MNEIVKLILSLSLSGSILAILIFALKHFAKHKLSKWVLYYVWLIVLLRLVVPYSFEGSLMNRIFYSTTYDSTIALQNINPTPKAADNAVANLEVPAKESGNAAETVRKNAPAKEQEAGAAGVNISNYYTESASKLLKDYALYLWLLGFLSMLAFNLITYGNFLKHVKGGNVEAGYEEKNMLSKLLKGKKQIKLIRNKFIKTPMLIGSLKPCILIPDTYYNEVQLKNILLHEITHHKRFDIGLKWLTMIASSIHWFNPIMYFIKKEVNHACELSCDEAVIKNLNAAEKQAYGDTLISVVAESGYSSGVLQATMCEEKKTLKERLLAIMNHSRKSKPVIFLSIVLILLIVSGALYLGAGIGAGIGALSEDAPPKLYINAEYASSKEALMGSYEWENKGKIINADAGYPATFQYKFDNIVSVTKNAQLILGTQKLKKDKKYEFTVDKTVLYKDNKPMEYNLEKPSFMNGNLYLQAPAESGEYIYVLTVTFKDKGTAVYGFIVRVDMPSYDLAKISKYKTPYIGDHSKVLALLGGLPVPENQYFRQQYISLVTDKKPYGLFVYYELREGEQPSSNKMITFENKDKYPVFKKNALVLFSMIDNLDNVTFAFRNSQSKGKLEEKAYESFITITRGEIKAEYGDISKLGSNLDLLEKALNNDKEDLQAPQALEGNYEALDKLPEVYNSQLAIKNGDVVFSLYKTYNADKFDEFYTAYKANKTDKTYMLRITLYTTEGDAIIHDLTMKGQEIKFIIDSSRDKFASAEARVRHEYKITDMTKEEKEGKIEYRLKGENAEFTFYLDKK